MIFEVLESAKRVSKMSRDVKINPGALDAAVSRMFEGGPMIPPWDSVHHFFDGGEKTVAYFLVLDSINFCFWPASGTKRWEINLGSRKVSGYNALAASLKQALESGAPLSRADYLAELTPEALRRLLGGQGALQLMEERARILQELGRVLLKTYEGDFSGPIGAAKGSAVTLARLLAQALASFRDVAPYRGETVFFLKRAQILAADLYGAFKGAKWGAFRDMDRLSAFADYKLPQVLRQLGVLCYGDALARKVDGRVLLAAGCPEEVEIRANTLWAVELIRRELGRRGRDLKAFEIDWALWNLGQDDRYRVRPYHRTRTIFY